MRNRLLFVSTLIVLLSGCLPDPEDKRDVVTEGYRPIYASRADMQRVFTETPHALRNAGKIYVRGSYVFVNEIQKGIHIIDNRQPAQPRNIAFISIPANVDIAVKGNILYADNGPDLIALDITDPTDVKVAKRIPDAFPNPMYPPQTGVSFECVDNAKGIVIGWEKVMLTNPKCHR